MDVMWGQTFPKKRRLGETKTRRNGCFANDYPVHLTINGAGGNRGKMSMIKKYIHHVV